MGSIVPFVLGGIWAYKLTSLLEGDEDGRSRLSVSRTNPVLERVYLPRAANYKLPTSVSVQMLVLMPEIKRNTPISIAFLAV